MATPMYMLRVDFSSLVIRAPYIRSRSTLLNQRLATSVTYFFQQREDGLRSNLNSLRWHLEVKSKLRTRRFARVPAHSPSPLGFCNLCRSTPVGSIVSRLLPPRSTATSRLNRPCRSSHSLHSRLVATKKKPVGPFTLGHHIQEA